MFVNAKNGSSQHDYSIENARRRSPSASDWEEITAKGSEFCDKQGSLVKEASVLQARRGWVVPPDADKMLLDG